MKRLLLALLLAGIGFGAWLVLGNSGRVLARLADEELLIPNSGAKVLYSSSYFRSGEHIIECRWDEVPFSKPDSSFKPAALSYQEILKKPALRERLDKFRPYIVGDISLTNPKFYSGEGSGFMSDFLLARLSNDRVLIWYDAY